MGCPWLVGLAVILAVSLTLTPLFVGAQQASKVWRIGILHTSAPKDEPDLLAALQQGLAELGYF